MIAIKGMGKIPETCSDCEMCHGHICKVTGIDIVANPKGDCPIVEIVTCRECKYNAYQIVKYSDDEPTRICCMKHSHAIYPCIDGFCSEGERRE